MLDKEWWRGRVGAEALHDMRCAGTHLLNVRDSAP